MQSIKTEQSTQVTVSIKARSQASGSISVELWDTISNKPIPGTLRTDIKAYREKPATELHWTLRPGLKGKLKALITFDGQLSHGHLVITAQPYIAPTVKLDNYAETPAVSFRGMQLDRTIF